MEQNNKFLRMTTQPVERLIVSLAIPTILIMLVSAMYNMADTYFVGQLGNAATGAVGVSFSLMAIIQATGFFFGQGAGNYISRALGAQKRDDAEKMAATGFFLAFFFGCVISAVGLLNLERLALFLGATDTILEYACDYLRFILLGTPFMVSSIMLNNLLRFQGSAIFSMIGMVTGAALNIILDPIFIQVLGLEVRGAALATMISQIVSFIVLFIGTTRGDNVHLHIRNFSPTPEHLKQIATGGLPSLLRQALMSVATIFLNRAARAAGGDAVIAAISVVNRIVMLTNSVMLGLGQGFQPVCGFNYGAGLYNRVKRGMRFCITVSAALLIICSTLCVIFAPQIITFFRDDPEVLRLGTFGLRIQALTMPLMSWIVLNTSMLQTTGQALPASILSLARQGFFQIPLLLILAPLLGVRGIQITSPIADVCTFALTIPFSIAALRRMTEPESVDLETVDVSAIEAALETVEEL